MRFARRSQTVRRHIPLILVILLGGCSNAFLVQPVKVPSELRMVVREAPDGRTRNKVAYIEVEGVLRQRGGSTRDDPVTRLRGELRLAEKDSSVKAVVLRINSPGGTAAASDLAYEEVMRFKRRSRKPVVAHITGLGTSGAYYVALAADEIYAAPASITGSIGVIMQLFNVQGLLAKIGVETQAIKTGEQKDMGSPFRELTEEDRKIFEQILDSFYARFTNLIAERRSGLSVEEVKKLADGRVYSASQADALGLVDAEAYPDAVFARAKSLAGISRARIAGFEKPFEGTGLGLAGAELNVKFDLPGADLAPGVYYLWLPGKSEP
ncbi:MAG: signal peptide peptidase SppA [Planctomycetota bacterium]